MLRGTHDMTEERSDDPPSPTEGITEEQLRKAEAYVEEEEGAANRLFGWAGTIVTTIAVASSLFHLYAAYEIVPTQPLRYIHVAFVLTLAFLLFPMAARFRNHIRWWDVVAAIASVSDGTSDTMRRAGPVSGTGVPRSSYAVMNETVAGARLAR